MYGKDSQDRTCMMYVDVRMRDVARIANVGCIRDVYMRCMAKIAKRDVCEM